MKQSAVELLIEQIKLKADSIATNTQLNRSIKGVYVDCLIMARQTKEMEKQQQDEFAIEFLDSIKEYERENGSRICFDERDSKELLEIFKNK
jgi:hypothetical protein